MITRIAKLGKTERKNLVGSSLAHRDRRVKIDLTKYEPSDSAQKHLEYVLSMMTLVEVSFEPGKKVSHLETQGDFAIKIA